MKTRLILLFSLVLGCLPANAQTDRDPTTINPALYYYQAFILAPNLSSEDENYLASVGTDGWIVPERAGKLLEGFDRVFDYVQKAARSKVPCDWGMDWTPGPETLLPQLGRCKAVAIKDRLRFRLDLQQGNQAKACDEWIATLCLARNTSRDQALIGTLVQFAMESILVDTVARNYELITPDSAVRLLSGIDAAPSRGTVAEPVAAEAGMHRKFLTRKIQMLREQSSGNESVVFENLHQCFLEMLRASGDSSDADKTAEEQWQRIASAAGGTSDGILVLVDELTAVTRRGAEILALPRPEYEVQIKQFLPTIVNSKNPLVAMDLPSFAKSRTKEFAVEAQMALLRAALENKIHGTGGLQSVMDPFGTGPLAYERFTFKGQDRGFRLTSALADPSRLSELILVEKDGPPFMVQGINIGKALPLPKQ